MDSIETTLKWEDQFLEMDQLNNSSSDDEIRLNEKFNYSLRVNMNIKKNYEKKKHRIHSSKFHRHDQINLETFQFFIENQLHFHFSFV